MQAAVLDAGSQLLDSLSALTPNPRPGVEPFDGGAARPKRARLAAADAAAHRSPQGPARWLKAPPWAREEAP